MNEKDCMILITLGKTQNITHAADRLFMTQSALSKRLKLIEQEFGTPLLIRSHQGVVFTPAGEKVLAYCITMTHERQKVAQELDMIEGEICGTFHAGYSISYGTYRLAQQISAYHKAYPKVNLQIVSDQSSQLYQQMLAGSLDLAIIRGEYPWNGIRYQIAEENVYLVYSKENQEKDLSDYMYINRKTDPLLTSQMLQWLGESSLTAHSSNISVDNITTCQELVQAGTGWAILPEIALEDFDGVKVQLYFKDGSPFIRRTYIFCQEGSAKLPQIDYFIRMIRNGI
ncbi:LysR family transcriptional regulator [Hespellia stercorisuis]|uniref:DNA-binding transcriptional regulator, LysR family n=1 Tax=Hespellia stercorisuis DSM 15480 TaxID=1121950 RepID=A0A1M6M4T3_9FIRM|nr:LysR family transcriptional regulator [Hespellia stercorisuis]SHJ78462.1 DNA-binding transcriptional regulator, LysR family [Hespellia stercorisuis DSM 15480]